MIHPVGQRENQRYRGPVESFKLQLSSNDFRQNLDLLHDTIEKLGEELKNVKSVLDRNKMYKTYDNIKELSEVE